MIFHLLQMILFMEVFEKIKCPIRVHCACGCNQKWDEVLEVTIRDKDHNTLRNPILVGALIADHKKADRN